MNGPSRSRVRLQGGAELSFGGDGPPQPIEDELHPDREIEYAFEAEAYPA